MGMRRWLPLLVWSTGLVLGTWFFHGLGQAELAAPPLDPAGWGAWAAARAPAVMVIAILRLVVLGLCWYLVGVTTIGLVGRLLRAAQLVRYADALAVPWLRRLLQQGLGLALATAMVTGAAGASSARTSHASGEASTGGGAAVTLRIADGPATATTVTAGPMGVLGPREVPPVGSTTAGRGDVPHADVRREPIPLPLRLLAPQVSAAEAEAELPPQVPAAEAEAELVPVRSHIVRAGDSLWRIAAQELADGLGRAPTDAEVVPYWRRVIAQNRAGLPDPDDPDLILPGQRVELPPLPGG